MNEDEFVVFGKFTIAAAYLLMILILAPSFVSMPSFIGVLTGFAIIVAGVFGMAVCFTEIYSRGLRIVYTFLASKKG